MALTKDAEDRVPRELRMGNELAYSLEAHDNPDRIFHRLWIRDMRYFCGPKATNEGEYVRLAIE